MNLPQIRLQTEFIRHGINITKPNQEIQQPKATMEISQRNAELNIETIPGKLTIDQNQAWADMGLKSVFERTEEAAQLGYEDWLQGLARVSRQGDELMKIHHKRNAIADLARENSTPTTYEFNIGWIPSPGSIKMNYVPADVRIDWQINKPNINVTTNYPIHNYTPGKVEGNIEKLNSLKIDFTNLYI